MPYEQTTPRREWIALLVADPDDYRPWMDGADLAHDDDTGAAVVAWAECGTCGRRWNDAMSTARTPAPSARCPFEDEHDDDEPPTVDPADLSDPGPRPWSLIQHPPAPATMLEHAELIALDLGALAERAEHTGRTRAATLYRIALRCVELAASPVLADLDNLDDLAESTLRLAADAERDQ